MKLNSRWLVSESIVDIKDIANYKSEKIEPKYEFMSFEQKLININMKIENLKVQNIEELVKIKIPTMKGKDRSRSKSNELDLNILNKEFQKPQLK